MKAPHTISADEIITFLDGDKKIGLSDGAIESKRQKYGRNSISQLQKKGWTLILLRQFANLMVYILLFAAALSFWFREWLDGIAILIVVMVNAIIGFYMEFQADRSMNALKKMAAVPAKALRNGHLVEIPSDELVPGDIIFVEAGDMIPADGRIFAANQLQINESSLTGESVPVEKLDNVLENDIVLAERVNCVYKGSFVTRGNSYAVVYATGMTTEFGKIAGMVQGSNQSATPLEKKLNAFTKKLIWVTLAMVGVIFIIGLVRGHVLIELIKTCIALAVAAIPEGMPIVSTLALAQSMMRMARQKVIMKKLSAVETLGGTNVICTDKTGTLTQNKMKVTLAVTPVITWKSEDGNQVTPAGLEHLVKACILCNTAERNHTEDGEHETGDPLEIALLIFSENLGYHIQDSRTAQPKLFESPFTPEAKMMATVHASGKEKITYVKGASEAILNKCSEIHLLDGVSGLSTELRTEWLKQADTLAGSGLRVIATAYKTTPDIPAHIKEELIFSGLIGMVDPLRPEVFQAIKECEQAGIRVMMITGDHPTTAKKIAIELGILASAREDILTGDKMKNYKDLSSAEMEQWANTRVFARVSPHNKLDLVTVLQEQKMVVAMTGDGVNDAPAIKKADIGIAMGLRGTQVAQEVADMILKDDSFSSIVIAIRQGRIIFDNIRKFVVFLLSCNLSELLLIAIVGVLDLHFQLVALQILFINLVTDVFPALALGLTKGSEHIMLQKPRHSEEPIIDGSRWKAIIFYSCAIAFACLAAVFVSHYSVHKTEAWNPVLCNNILFYTLIISQLFHAFNMDSGKGRWFHSDVIRNKYLWLAVSLCAGILVLVNFFPVSKQVLSLNYVSVPDMVIILGGGILSFAIIRLSKIFGLTSI